ncbi:uridine kinase [Marinomonas sp. M1K-6]|uniref:Uridine kinase n=1 Tax=Marinomonas profundi TaxID=2726122 RepID=A0A847R1X4_9GAMM|nr:uridine kinase [Marinomonas profundi]NLQ17791.1 uridine kinase [Marinomonas profundi]UDV04346.1 uridine kinase [Marinomonas profundi]
MPRKITLIVTMVALLATSGVFANTALTAAQKDIGPRISKKAELFALPFNDLSLSRLENQLSGMGLRSDPSYKDGVVSYGLGPEGILGVTNATLHSNTSGYVHQALLSGVIESREQRKALGQLLEKKYGDPSDGDLQSGMGHAIWLFQDSTRIELRNSTFDVSVLYVDERPRVVIRSGQIDVEALSRENP